MGALEAEASIRQLVARYCDSVARRDAESCGATFTEDAVWEVLGRRAEGRSRIVSLWTRLVSSVPWVVQIPTVHLIDIDADGTTGRGRCYVTESMVTGDGTPGSLMGVYDDDYVLAPGGGWLFARRSLTVLYSGPATMTAEHHVYEAPPFGTTKRLQEES